MSGSEFQVQGPHDHEFERQAQSSDGFAARFVIMTVFLTTIGAMVVTMTRILRTGFTANAPHERRPA
ncbi:MAG: hypothetical protein ABI777_08360 [Betaproteobacteria bacterium]